MGAESPVVDTGSVLHDGTLTLAGGAAVPLNDGGRLPCKRVMVQSDPENAQFQGQYVSVGNDTSQSVRLAAGVAETIEIDDAVKVYVDGPQGARVNWHATGQPPGKR